MPFFGTPCRLVLNLTILRLKLNVDPKNML